jgi:HAD superfamily hydrolase (TIGR01450 family)
VIYKSFSYLYNKYDSYLVDVYGVLYDGSNFFNEALDLLEKMKNSGGKVVILSNTTFVSKVCEERYQKKGLLKGVHYDEFISSGEAFRCTLEENLHCNAKTYYQIFNRNKDIFNDSNLKEATEIEDEDFVYVGALNTIDKIYTADNLQTTTGEQIPIENITSVNCKDIKGLEAIYSILETCMKYNKILVIVNPDIFALETIMINDNFEKRPVLCQGAIGEFYEMMGGRVIYFGKPYLPIYEFAKKFLAECTKTVMIGDTLWTDILGGNMANVDTVLTLTGVSKEFFKTMNDGLTINEKINILTSEIASKMTHRTLLKFSQEPTYIVESFAA